MAIKRAKTIQPGKRENPHATPAEFGDVLKMVVKTTYFRFQGKICEQTFSMSIGFTTLT